MASPHKLGLDDMLTLFFARLRAHAEQQFGMAPDRALVGRPVRFAGSTGEAADTAAMERIRGAATRSGFASLEFELEPIAAAYHYERTLHAPERVLVPDFGGGTTDLCLMTLGPERTRNRDRRADIIATGGVGIAGDDLDATIIENLVCPHLGKGSTYRDMGRELEIPRSYYDKLSRWHHLSFLNDRKTRAQLERLHKLARRPELLENLVHLIETNQGFHLHKAVERLNITLSSADRGRFAYEEGPLRIDEEVQRSSFETWIAPCVAGIAEALDEILGRARLEATRVDRVFMTGGTAHVPAVRRVFIERFGAEKLQGGDELLSIASGLALRAEHVSGDV